MSRRGSRSLERARRAILALRLRDRRPRVPAERRRRRGRLPGRLHARSTRASTRSATTRRSGRGSRSSRAGAASTRSRARVARLLPTTSSPTRRPHELAEVEEAFERPRGDGRAPRRLPGHPRPLLRARPELQDDLRRARHPVGNDREPHRPVPQEAAQRAGSDDCCEGRNDAPEGSRGLDERLHDEERLGVLLRLLRPAPRGWVRAAQELPAARQHVDEIVARAEADLAFRNALIADLERALAARGLRARPPHPRRDPRASERKLNGSGRRGSGAVESTPVQDVTSHGWDAGKAALPAWSLPKDAVDRIALPPTGPSASRASGRSAARPGEGVRVCILDSGVDASHPLVGELESAVVDLGRRERRGRRGGGRGGRRLRSRHGLRRHRAPARARGRGSRAYASSARASPAAGAVLLGGLRYADRAGLRRDQHEPLDDEEAVRERAPRARRQRVLQTHGARRLGAQHAGGELPVALLVGHLGREPRGARPARLLLQPEPAGRVLRPRRQRRGALARRAHADGLGEQLRDAAHDARSAR